MQELEPTWSRALRIWWLLLWRGILGAALIGAVAGFVVGFIGGLTGVPTATITLVSGILGGLIGIGWAIVVVRMALRKRYGDFRIVLVPHGAGAA
jgi:hypothetical protein